MRRPYFSFPSKKKIAHTVFFRFFELLAVLLVLMQFSVVFERSDRTADKKKSRVTFVLLFTLFCFISVRLLYLYVTESVFSWEFFILIFGTGIWYLAVAEGFSGSNRPKTVSAFVFRAIISPLGAVAIRLL